MNLTSKEKYFLKNLGSNYIPTSYKTSLEFIEYLRAMTKFSKSNFINEGLDFNRDYSKFKLHLIKLYRELLDIEIEFNKGLVFLHPNYNFNFYVNECIIELYSNYSFAFEAIAKFRINDLHSSFMKDLYQSLDCRDIPIWEDYYTDFSCKFCENIYNYCKLYKKLDRKNKYMMIYEFLNLLNDLKRTIIHVYNVSNPLTLKEFKTYGGKR